MSAGAPATREDLTAPATKADLMVLKSDLKSAKADLEGQIKLLRSDLDRVDARLTAKIDVSIAEVKTSLTYTVWLAMATLGGAMALLRLFLSKAIPGGTRCPQGAPAGGVNSVRGHCRGPSQGLIMELRWGAGRRGPDGRR